MGHLNNAFPNLDSWEPFECSHEWLGDVHGYGDEQHVMLVAFGGRPGYVAITADRDDDDLRAWIRQARQLYRRVIVDTCGYGGPPDKRFVRKGAMVIAEVS